jgi:hypothetical protein
MTSERLDDPVAVRVDFAGGRATPVLFRRRGRVHRVREVAARWEERRGAGRVLYFSCLDDAGDLYQLRFDGADFLWRLEFVQLCAEAAR